LSIIAAATLEALCEAWVAPYPGFPRRNTANFQSCGIALVNPWEYSG